MCIRDRGVICPNNACDMNCVCSFRISFLCVFMCLYISNCSRVSSLWPFVCTCRMSMLLSMSIKLSIKWTLQIRKTNISKSRYGVHKHMVGPEGYLRGGTNGTGPPRGSKMITNILNLLTFRLFYLFCFFSCER